MSFQLMIKTAEDLAAQALDAATARITAAIDAHVEAQAQALGYNSAAHIAGYAASTVPAWAAEAAAFIAWRDAVWLAAFAAQAAAEAAQVIPTEADVIAALPPYPLPGA